MYSVIRTENTPDSVGDGDDRYNRDDGDSDDDESDDDESDGDAVDDLKPLRPAWRESKSRRRVLRTDGLGRKTREETNRNQTSNFFGSKKIVSRQRNRKKEKKISRSRNTGGGNRRRDRLEQSRTPAKERVDERLQKVKQLFELIKVSKKKKSIRQDTGENMKSRKFNNFPIRRRATARLGDNSNDANILERKHKTVSKSKVSALEKLYKIAGDDWVKTHIER